MWSHGLLTPVHHLTLVVSAVLHLQPGDDEVPGVGDGEPVVVGEHEVAHAQDLQRFRPQPADLNIGKYSENVREKTFAAFLQCLE